MITLQRFKKIVEILGCLFFLFACSSQPPRIEGVRLRLVYAQKEGKIEEFLSLFISPADDDGFEDLEELYLIHDESQLYWKLTPQDWLSIEGEENSPGALRSPPGGLFQEEGLATGEAGAPPPLGGGGKNDPPPSSQGPSRRVWIGSHRIQMYPSGPLPRGRYRIILRDKGGEQVERSVGLDAPLTPVYPFPQLILDRGSYRIVSSYPKNDLVVYDQDLRLIRTVPLSHAQGAFRDLDFPGSARAVALWAEDPDRGIAALTSIQELP
ncbi:MAG TPA: hypothetical protein PLW34_05935 [Termitinemataceae bacterium]|nr:hypothetical protein [Termitinemataceae bacterium]HOM22962.1 hypothetical protein [Termitinemataceae bacterium]HPQ00303.1 hypothetical protein [Termitinemataceae bacterium]